MSVNLSVTRLWPAHRQPLPRLLSLIWGYNWVVMKEALLVVDLFPGLEGIPVSHMPARGKLSTW